MAHPSSEDSHRFSATSGPELERPSRAAPPALLSSPDHNEPRRDLAARLLRSHPSVLHSAHQANFLPKRSEARVQGQPSWKPAPCPASLDLSSQHSDDARAKRRVIRYRVTHLRKRARIQSN